MPLANSPAQIIQYWLTSNIGALTLPTANTTWPVFRDSMGDVAKDAVCVYDTGAEVSPTMRKSVMPVVEKPSIQVRVKALDYSTCWTNVKTIVDALVAIKNATQAVGGNNYVIRTVTQATSVIRLEDDQDKRNHLTVNFNLDIATA